jgi:hypothetical protein
MGVVWRYHTPSRVIFGMDLNILTRDESSLTSDLPSYLYDANPLNDAQYLLNKDALYYSVYSRIRPGEPLDEAFTWDETTWWNHETALANYRRPAVSAATLGAGAYLVNVDANLSTVTRWVTEHPDTEFDLFLPPYSILFWDKTERLGETEAVFAAIGRVCDTLLPYDNVKLYGFLMDGDIVMDLDNYCDYIHHSGAVSDEILALMAAGQYRLTEDNARQTIESWRAAVDSVDFEQYWDESFWAAWDQSPTGD